MHLAFGETLPGDDERRLVEGFEGREQEMGRAPNVNVWGRGQGGGHDGEL